MNLQPFVEVLDDVRAGKMVVIVDDENREAEGDLMVASELVLPEHLAFMMEEGRGLICISLTEERLRALQIPFQVRENSSHFGTNFATSFDLKGLGEDAVSAQGRAATIRHAVALDASPADFVLPGYVFPVGAVPAGVLKRQGQTEGAVELARIAGLAPSGVICEIMSADGRMLYGEELERYCAAHGLKMTSVEAIRDYRLHNEICLRRVAQAPLSAHAWWRERLSELLPSAGDVPLQVVVYADDVDDQEHVAFLIGRPVHGSLVRVHSECLTGDVFSSERCDCGQQFDESLRMMLAEGSGVIVYLYQEGRGIGLGNKLRAYELQDNGLDTVDANLSLGFAVDSRSYRAAAHILSDLGLRSIRLMTHNPDKLRSLRDYGIEVTARISLPLGLTEHNTAYIQAKRDRLGHLF